MDDVDAGMIHAPALDTCPSFSRELAGVQANPPYVDDVAAVPASATFVSVSSYTAISCK
jgi:hypothetical protein